MSFFGTIATDGASHLWLGCDISGTTQF